MADILSNPTSPEDKLIEELGFEDHFHDHHDEDKYASSFIGPLYLQYGS